MAPSHRPIRVLVVDDSRVFRRFLVRALEADPMLEVIGEASCSATAKTLLRSTRPDVITLDLEMPGEDGLQFLRSTIVHLKIPTVVISSKTQRGTQMSIEALEAGAVDVFPKPRGFAPGQPPHEALADVGARLKGLARARMDHHPIHAPRQKTCWSNRQAKDWVIAIGASTGGVQALNTLPKPVIGRVQGNAFGGGVGMACVCDVAIGVDGLTMGFTETRLGLIPATIGPYVVARMGEARARRVFMSARLFKAEEAVALDILARVVPADRLDDAVERADQWLSNGDSASWVPNDPIFRQLEDRPEYPDLLARNAEQLERQRQIYLSGKVVAHP